MPTDRKLTVTLSLSARTTDGPFSRTVNVSHGLSREAYHAFQQAVAEMLLSLGDRANAAAKATDAFDA